VIIYGPVSSNMVKHYMSKGQVHEVNSEKDSNLVDIIGDEKTRLASCSSA
jgi:hypothetical protein